MKFDRGGGFAILAFLKKALTYVTASDEAVVGGLLVSVVSFLHHHRDAEALRVGVIDGGIGEESWGEFAGKLGEWCGKAGLRVELERWPGELERWQHFPPHWGSWAVYSSLDVFLKDLSGLVVFGDVDFLHGRAVWEAVDKVAGHVSGVGAVVDRFKATVGCDRYVELVRPGVGKAVDYVNSGFFVVDRDRFDAEGFGEFLGRVEPKVLERKAGKRPMHDQTLLNAYFAGEVALLDAEWNWVANDALGMHFGEEARNLHFVGQPKPWAEGSEDTPERLVAWMAACDGLGLPGASLDFGELGGRAAEVNVLQRLVYRLLGKGKKLERLQAGFDEGELRVLFDKVRGWFD